GATTDPQPALPVLLAESRARRFASKWPPRAPGTGVRLRSRGRFRDRRSPPPLRAIQLMLDCPAYFHCLNSNIKLLFDQIKQLELGFRGPPTDTSQFDTLY